jgi:hypothetical protein
MVGCIPPVRLNPRWGVKFILIVSRWARRFAQRAQLSQGISLSG